MTLLCLNINYSVHLRNIHISWASKNLTCDTLIKSDSAITVISATPKAICTCNWSVATSWFQQVVVWSLKKERDQWKESDTLVLCLVTSDKITGPGISATGSSRWRWWEIRGGVTPYSLISSCQEIGIKSLSRGRKVSVDTTTLSLNFTGLLLAYSPFFFCPYSCMRQVMKHITASCLPPECFWAPQPWEKKEDVFCQLNKAFLFGFFL